MSTYELRVNGRIPPGLIERLSPIRAVQPAGTALEIDVTDEAALWGLIDALRSAGVDLLEVRRLNPPSPTSPSDLTDEPD
jgi:hypothetical protein